MEQQERLWQHEETGRMCWHTSPGKRWNPVPLMFEDELPDNITDEEYAQWFQCSKVPNGVGCRIGPFFTKQIKG